MNGAEETSVLAEREAMRTALRSGALSAITRRDLLQSARNTKAVAWVCAATVLLAVVVATAGAVLAPKWDPADLGLGLYQLTFSLGLAVVCLWGTMLGARRVRAELSRQTWPLLQLSGAPTRHLVWGKWLAAWLELALWILAAAPLTALPYLCGGVHAADLALGVALLLWAAAAACCAGVALGASPARSALQRMLPAACGLGLAAFAVGVAGYIGSLFARLAFPGLPSGPFWFAAAYRHAAWDLADVSLLVVTPLAASVGFGVGAVELCAARLSLPGPSRLAGVKGWSIGGALALLSVGFMLRTWWVARDHFHWASVVCIALLNGFGLSLLWLFSEERPGEVRTETGLFAALRSSGLFASTRFVWRLTALATLLAAGAGALQELHSGRVLMQDPRAWLLALGALAVSQLLFTHFCIGLIRLLRARRAAADARKRFARCVLGLWFVPWLLAFGLGTLGKLQDWLWLAALSPGYALTLAHQLRDRFVQLDLAFWVHVASCLVWLGAGLAASHVAQRTTKGAART